MYTNKAEVFAAITNKDVKALVNAMDGTDYDSGAVEAAQVTATRNSKVIASIIMHLVATKHLPILKASQIISDASGIL